MRLCNKLQPQQQQQSRASTCSRQVFKAESRASLMRALFDDFSQSGWQLNCVQRIVFASNIPLPAPSKRTSCPAIF
eukprot:1161241-Pelagomonas_calceolata.AAC.2